MSANPGAGEFDRRDVEALAAARAELGPDYESALLDSFADKVESTIQRRVDQAVAERGRSHEGRTQDAKRQFALGCVSLVFGIPITAISSENAGLGGLVAAWLGIAAVNAAHALQGRRGP